MNRTLSDSRVIRSRGTWRSLDGTNGLPGPVLCFHQDGDGHLWMGTWGRGIALYDGNTIRTMDSEIGLAGDRVWVIVSDALGATWIGTTTGLSCWDGSSFRQFDMTAECAGIDVNDLLVLENEKVWVAHEAGLAVYDDEQGLRAADVVLPGKPLSLARSADGMWIGCSEGVAFL
jgi:ligand-binding sensor domain-containing protein